MSPVGGQGLNIALRDAVVAANHLVPAAAPHDPTALDAAAQRIEAERLPEVEFVQRRQAQPPRVVLSHAWWGEPVRRLIAVALSSSFGRGRLVSLARLFQFGVTPVKLEV